MRIRQRPLPISAPPSNVAVFRRPPPPPEVYDWQQSDPEIADDTDADGWITSELGEPN